MGNDDKVRRFSVCCGVNYQKRYNYLLLSCNKPVGQENKNAANQMSRNRFLMTYLPSQKMNNENHGDRKEQSVGCNQVTKWSDTIRLLRSE
jgi:hypothetical protein